MNTAYHPHGPYTYWQYHGDDAAFMRPTVEWMASNIAAEATDDPDAEAGWYARLSAPGYLDCTDWQGPYPSAFRAVRDLCRTFDVKLNGNLYDW